MVYYYNLWRERRIIMEEDLILEDKILNTTKVSVLRQLLTLVVRLIDDMLDILELK